MRRVSRYAIRRNSGGQDTYRGGDGVVRELAFLGDAQATMISDRRENPPYGLESGAPAKTGENLLIHRQRRRKLPSKFNMQVEAGDRLVISTSGGGYGNREGDRD